MFREVGIKAAVRWLVPSGLLRTLREKAIASLLLSDLTSPHVDPDDLFWRWLQPEQIFALRKDLRWRAATGWYWWRTSSLQSSDRCS